MNLLHTVFWDLDGTIADTEMMGHRKAFNSSFKEFGLDWLWDEETYIQLLAISGGKNRIEYFAKKNNVSLDKSSITLLHQNKQAYYREIMLSGDISLRRGVMRLVTELYNNNVNQWIVTTSSKSAVESILQKLFPSNYNPFAGSITFEDVNRHKPDPSAYYKAIKVSNARRENSIAIEDSIIGYQAAKATELKIVITLSPWLKNLPNGMEFADLVVDNLGDEFVPSNSLLGPMSEQIVTHNILQSIINR